MKIISINNLFIPLRGGVPIVSYNFQQWLLKNTKAEPLTIFGGYGKNESGSKFDDIEIVDVKTAKLFQGDYSLAGIGFFRQVYKTLKANPDNVTIINGRHFLTSLWGALACKLLRQNYIYVEHGFIYEYFTFKPLNFILNVLDKVFFSFVVNNSAAKVFVSDTVRSNFRRQLKRINLSDSHVIYNGFEEKILQNLTNIKQKQQTVIFAGRWADVKDPHTTFQAFQIAAKNKPNWKFQFIGNGKYEPNLTNLPKNIEVINKMLPQEELFNYLSNSAIYINSSLSEGSPLASSEAGALGNIPIVSDAQANKEWLAAAGLDIYKNLVFTRQNPTELAEKITEAIEIFEKDPAQYQQISKTVTNNLGNEVLFKKYFDLVQNVYSKV